MDKKLLILNGAEELLQVVLTEGQEAVFVQELKAPGQGLCHLPGAVTKGLDILGTKAEALDGIACVRGPGSFTGLRVVLALGQGLGLSAGVPLAGLDYLSLLAQGVALCAPCPEVWVCTHARRFFVYLQGFSLNQGQEVKSLSELPVVLSLEQAWQVLAQRAASDFAVVGSGIKRNLDWWGERLKERQILPDFLSQPLIPVLVDQGCKATYSLQQIRPLYLRLSDAEENLPQIAKAKGLTAEEAREAFAASELQIRKFIL